MSGVQIPIPPPLTFLPFFTIFPKLIYDPQVGTKLKLRANEYHTYTNLWCEKYFPSLNTEEGGSGLSIPSSCVIYVDDMIGTRNTIICLRGAITVNRIYGAHKNVYIFLFFLLILLIINHKYFPLSPVVGVPITGGVDPPLAKCGRTKIVVETLNNVAHYKIICVI